MPITGSDGSLYKILSDMGHTIIEPLPSLVSLNANEPYLNKWNGIRCDATITSIVDGCPIKHEKGELQLTDNGISGICVFNISSDIVKALSSNKTASVEINFINIDNPIEYFTTKYNDLTIYEILLRYIENKCNTTRQLVFIQLLANFSTQYLWFISLIHPHFFLLTAISA